MSKAHKTDKFIKVEETKNYIIQVVKQLRGVSPRGYRRKVIYDKDGYRHILNLAIVCEKGKAKSRGNRKCKTVVTSIWHPKDEPKARKLLQKAKKQGKFVKKAREEEVYYYTIRFKTSWFNYYKFATLLEAAMEEE